MEAEIKKRKAAHGLFVRAPGEPGYKVFGEGSWEQLNGKHCLLSDTGCNQNKRFSSRVASKFSAYFIVIGREHPWFKCALGPSCKGLDNVLSSTLYF